MSKGKDFAGRDKLKGIKEVVFAWPNRQEWNGSVFNFLDGRYEKGNYERF